MHNEKKKKEKYIKEKLHKYCAIQERCKSDIKKKLYQWGVNEDIRDDLIEDLVLNKFIEEERFAILFSNTKFRIRKWGRIKISYELKKKFLEASDIEKGLASIDTIQYEETLIDLLKKKLSSIKEDNIFRKKQKASKYLAQKGFESKLIWKHLNLYTDK